MSDLPASVDCLVVAVAADAACDVLEEAHARGIPAAIVLAAGFGEGGHGHARAARLRSLADQGMCICGPNCFGLISVKAGFAAYSGPLARPLRAGPVAIVSQSGGLGANVFAPLMTDRELGFSHFVSCGNQIGATVEDYIEYFIDDPDITVIAAVIEAAQEPAQADRASPPKPMRGANPWCCFRPDARRPAGSWCSPIPARSPAMPRSSRAFLRRCGIVQVERYDEFVETVELFAIAPRDETVGRELVVISGSGGGAAIAADALQDAGAALASLHPATKERIAAVLPEFGSITNPIDGTGAIYDDPALLPKIVDAILTDPGPAGHRGERRREAGRQRDDAALCPDIRRRGARVRPHRRRLSVQPAWWAARFRDRQDAAWRAGSAAAGDIERDGRAEASAAAARLLDARGRNRRGSRATWQPLRIGRGGDPSQWDFLTARQALVASGVPVVDAALAHSDGRSRRRCCAGSAPRSPSRPRPRAFCTRATSAACGWAARTSRQVRDAYAAVVRNARNAGFEGGVLIQPMIKGVAEAYAGIIDDPLFGPAICFGLGGVFVEILR